MRSWEWPSTNVLWLPWPRSPDSTWKLVLTTWRPLPSMPRELWYNRRMSYFWPGLANISIFSVYFIVFEISLVCMEGKSSSKTYTEWFYFINVVFICCLEWWEAPKRREKTSKTLFFTLIIGSLFLKFQETAIPEYYFRNRGNPPYSWNKIQE